MQHAVTPFCKGHPRWVVLSGGWGLIPLIPIGWLQWGLGVPRSRRGGAPGVSLQTDHRGVILHPWDRD